MRVGAFLLRVGFAGMLGVSVAACGSSSREPPRAVDVEFGDMFLWPVAEGRLSSRFGPRGGAPHEGIDIAAPIGSVIRAARSGRVTFSGMARGYGYTIIVQHESGVSTRYGHNQRNLVAKGDRVRRGQAIALVGMTGRSHGPHVHFEVRERGVPSDPLSYFPRRRTQAARLEQ